MKGNKQIIDSEEIQKFIVESYQCQHPLKKIGEYLETSPKTIRDFLVGKGIRIRTKKEALNCRMDRNSVDLIPLQKRKSMNEIMEKIWADYDILEKFTERG